jgi:signal transduction histidine kinase
MTPAAITLLAPDTEPTELATRAHAIKNCASVIIGLARSVEPHVSPVALPRLMQLLDSSQRLHDLIVRREGEHAGDRDARAPVPVDLVFRLVTDRLAPLAEQAGVVLAVECDGGFVVGHLSELAEAMYNLAANAVQASPRGARVQVTTRVTAERDHEWSVCDRGCGIPAGLVRQLGLAGVPSRTGGMGLGLAIALRIIRSHVGTLRVQSAEGSGTTMTVWLPGGATPSETG